MGLREEVLQVAGEGRTALVIGLGVSGIASINFLHSLRLRVIAFERQTEAAYCSDRNIVKEIKELRKQGIEIYFGIDSPSTCPEMDDVAICIISPGVPTKHPIVKLLRGRGVPCIGELELGVVLANRRSIIVTGSNGKSTTVSLIDEMLKSSGIKSFLCGNVGTPVVSILDSEDVLKNCKSDGVLVVEASSYQLETCTILRPDVGVFLNLSENHLERHGSMDEYASAKRKLFAKQTTSDFAILNDDDKWSRGVKESIRSKVALFGANIRGSDFSKIRYSPETGEDRIEISLNGSTFVIDLTDSKLKGIHNRYNIAAAALAALCVGATKEGIEKAIKDFSTLEHRFEVLQNTGNMVVINDSKSTTVASTTSAVETAISTYQDAPILLMVGGLAKKNSWAPLREVLSSDRIHATICFGKDGKVIAEMLPSKDLEISVTQTMKEGVLLAFKKAPKGSVILFSPACASFDEFKDFEDRGARFKEYVKEVLSGKV